MKKITVILSLVLCPFVLSAQSWWGASVGLGHEQPYTDLPSFDLKTQDANNQLVPLFLSSEGEYMWSDNAFRFEAKDGKIITSEQIADEWLRQTFTGDERHTALWMGVSLLSLAGILLLARRRKEEE